MALYLSLATFYTSDGFLIYGYISIHIWLVEVYIGNHNKNPIQKQYYIFYKHVWLRLFNFDFWSCSSDILCTAAEINDSVLCGFQRQFWSTLREESWSDLLSTLLKSIYWALRLGKCSWETEAPSLHNTYWAELQPCKNWLCAQAYSFRLCCWNRTSVAECNLSFREASLPLMEPQAPGFPGMQYECNCHGWRRMEPLSFIYCRWNLCLADYSLWQLAKVLQTSSSHYTVGFM